MPNKPKVGALSGKTGGIQHKWWLVGGAAIGGAAFLYYRNAGSSSVDPAVTTATDPYADTTGDSGYSYDGYGTGGGGVYGGGSTTDTADIAQSEATMAAAAVDSATALGNLAGATQDIANAQPGPPETNRHWQHQAVQWLLAHGYTPAQAHAAVNAYLAGAPMTAKQVNTVESAVGHVGPPPQGSHAITTKPVEKPHHKNDRSKHHKKKPHTHNAA